MKTYKILYWLSTSVFSIWMLSNASGYLNNPEAKKLCLHFGFPDYFRVELAIAKIIGTALLLIPCKNNLKEWTYSGFFITVISGFIAHICSGDSLLKSFSAIIAFMILLLSYFSFHKIIYKIQ
ncbi:MAG: DoxX family protein [Chryseobacterium sp.]|nr:DoxX family protein [Chryseobacterium sp.]